MGELDKNTQLAATTECKVCGETVRPGIVICPKCGKYQKRWRNEANYFVSILGLVSLVAGAVTFVVSEVASAMKTRSPAIVAFRSDTALVVFNPAPDSLMVKQATARYGDGEHEAEDIYAEIESGKMKKVDLGEPPSKEEKEYFVCRNHKRAKNEVAHPGSHFRWVFFSTSDPDYTRYEAAFTRNGGTLKAENCALTLTYEGFNFFGQLTHLDQDIDCAAAIKLRVRPLDLPEYTQFFCQTGG